jgi:hypothetical protein
MLPPPPWKMGIVPHTCYNCGQVGHIVRDCTAPRQIFAPHRWSHCHQPPHGPTKVDATKTSRVNYTTIKDVPEGEQVLAGTFSLNGHLIAILFDSGASHDFISKACTQKCQLVIEHMSTRYMILTPGGNVITQQLVINAPLNLPGKVYKTHLIVLEGQGIDVILGMSWMRNHIIIKHCFSHRVVGLSRPWYYRSPAAITLKYHPQVPLPYFIIPLPKSWKIFMLHASFQMFFSKTC